MRTTGPPVGMRTQPGPTGLAVLDQADIDAGYPFGFAPAGSSRPAGLDSPGAALRAALLTALRRPPCLVAFSGGRDSSLLLAVAAELAGQAGLPAPVAFTLRYPGDPAAAESGWQELVMRHLRARGLAVEWERRAIRDELDLIGPLAAPVLRGHGGPVFPAAIAPTVLLTTAAAGGSLVTGNFGDEVLGDHRATLLRAVWRRRGRRMTRSDWYTTATAAAPAPLRARLVRAREPGPEWLLPPLRAMVRTRQAVESADRPLRWDRSVRSVLRPRAVALGTLTRRRIAADHDCALVEPFGEPAVIAALARHGGSWGCLGRGAAVRLLAGELLPAEVATRRDKARFNRSRFGPATREFAAGWDGTGVDLQVIDPAALRRAWLADEAPAGSALLLQQAWLAAHGGPR